MSLLRALFAGVLLVVGIVTSQAARANPNGANPDVAFEVLGKEAWGAAAAEGAKLYKQAATTIVKHVATLETGRADRINPQDLGQTVVALQQLERVGRNLTLAAETAGEDFTTRASEAGGVNRRIIEATRGTPAAVAYLEKARAIIARSQEQRMRELEQIKRFGQNGQWEQAETRFYKTYDQLTGLTYYITSGDEWNSIYRPYSDVQPVIDQAMATLRRKAALEHLTQLSAAHAPDLDALAKDLEAVIQSVAQEGGAAIDGQTLDGPALVAHFAQRWKAAQAATLRCRAIHWALLQVRQNGGESVDTSQPDPLETQYHAFSHATKAALVRLVEADANRVAGPDAARLHGAYQTALAAVSSNVSDASFTAAAQKALDQLAAKAPDLHEATLAYRAATEELLRWRRRTAEAAAASRMASDPPAPQRLFQATQGKQNFAGLFYETNPEFPYAQLFASAPTVVRWAEDKLLQQPVVVPATTALESGKTGISRYGERTYCSVALPPLPPELLAALERDLLVSEGLPPLSLMAEAAIQSARRGDLVSVGGTIGGYHLESVLARFGNLPPAAWVVSSLGSLPPAEPQRGSLSRHVLARFDVTPQWVRHEFFFAELPVQ